ncbi:hypothetical protein [uncultured Helicobacter sp.]|uniref:hypothetical protein n=1 Tax=uncultured Helicobacter sp. TaxID=175537 RepID=UPI00374EDDA8
MEKFLCILLCLCGISTALDYSTLSKSKTYQEWLTNMQDNIMVCNNPQNKQCQEVIAESCASFVNNTEDYTWCKDKIISSNTSTYDNYRLLANDTPLAITTMIEKEDISGLIAIIKAMPDVIGKDIATLEEEQGSAFVEKTLCYGNISAQSLEVLLKYGKLDPQNRKCNEENNSLLEFAIQKLNESKAKGDSQTMEKYNKIVEILKKYNFK